jgi:hypothetical protein
MKKTEPIRQYVMRLLVLLMLKLENIETLLPPLLKALPIMKISYNKLKLIYNKLNTIMKKPLLLSKPEQLKEKPNIKHGLMKIIKIQLKLPP